VRQKSPSRARTSVFGKQSQNPLSPMHLCLRTTSGSSAALGESSIRLGVKWNTLIEQVLPLIFYTSLTRKCATVLRRNWFQRMFRPERGLWFLSGYVLSKKGAQALLGLLPCRGPIDLWINHKFQELDVRALRRSVINQRLDTPSTNSYSILPALNRIGVLDDCDAALFHQRPTLSPVFAFGTSGSGLSSLAMALSMLGYRCCSDIDRIPESEFEKLFAGHAHRVFNAYVNVGSLQPHVRE